MSARPEIVSAEPILIASVRRRATSATVGKLIQSSGVWDLMKARGIASPGHNVVVYWATPTQRLNSAQGIDIDIGADVAARFDSDDTLHCTETPAGRVLRMTHVGPYSELGRSYDVLAEFARANNLDISGPFWEVYGHWTAATTKLETEINHLIA